jgi:predicted nuclease with TOPRIM domain
MRSYRTAIDRKRIQWEEITLRLGSLLDRLPYLRVPHDELVRKVAETRQLESEIVDLRARLNEALKRLEETAREGERLRGRLTLALKAEYGVDNHRLKEFGLKARRPRGRNKKSAEGEPAG